MRGARILVAAAIVIAGCSARESVPRGETVVVVDTDLPVPDVVTTARIDVYAEDGTWLVSRDVEAADPRSWPVSFGLAAGDTSERRVVRVRVFPRHRLRDYVGVRRSAPAPSPVITTPSTVEEMCRSLPELAIGGQVKLHYGAKKVTSTKGEASCPSDGPGTFKALARGGAAAARVTVTQAGSYRFSALRFTPPGLTDSLLMLRRDCADAESELACYTTKIGNALAVDLEPGTYALVVAGGVPLQEAEVVVSATQVGVPIEAAPPASDAGAVPAAAAPTWPRLVVAGARDETPSSEPHPEVTSETFVTVELVPGRAQSVRIVASGACVNQPAVLDFADERRLDLLAARTCRDGQMGALAPALAADGDGATRAGTFSAARKCEDTAPERVCVEGGMFVLGSDLYGGTGIGSTTPQRTARISTFYVDRQEFSVADYRAVVAAGYVHPGAYVVATEGKLDVGSRISTNICTFSAADRGREDHPLNCVAWVAAREMCQQRGGDLPTEAMWEYMARKAGRTRSTSYPWGDDTPACERTVFDRSPNDDQASGTCLGQPGGAGPQARSSAPDDLNPLGIQGLGGNVDEWCRDSFVPYDHDCWRKAPLDDPWCQLDYSPMRSTRGGSWGVSSPLMASSLRDTIATMSRASVTGFRCVYSAP